LADAFKLVAPVKGELERLEKQIKTASAVR
jgi:hypothetical protein